MQVRMMQVWRQSPMIWLFAATFALTFALVNRGQEHRSSGAVGATGVTGAGAPVRETARLAAASSMQSTAGKKSSEAAQPASQTLPPVIVSDESFTLIETAIAAEGASVRNTAISSLSQLPAAQVPAVVEQVLRTDDDRNNRLLALQVLLQLPDAAGLHQDMLRVVTQFVQDPDPYIAGAAAQAQEGLENAAENCRWSSSGSPASGASSCALR